MRMIPLSRIIDNRYNVHAQQVEFPGTAGENGPGWVRYSGYSLGRSACVQCIAALGLATPL